ncbi:MAG: Rab family GTPase [Candidatus Heimdallarchaeota archaeon]
MANENSSPQGESEEKSIQPQKRDIDYTDLAAKLTDNAAAKDIEEFHLKVKGDLEEALSGKTDYMSILEQAYSLESKDSDDFLRFGLEKRPAQTEDIFLISCFRKSGYPLFTYRLAESKDLETSLSFILNTIKNYVQYKLGELLEVLALESQTIQFFVVEDAYIIAVVTSRGVQRDQVGALAVDLSHLIREYPNQTPESSPPFREAVDRIIEATKASFVREHYAVKIVLAGDGAVGKTSIRRQYLGEGFQEDYQMTIGADLATKSSSTIYPGGKQIKFVIWDLAGQPRFDVVRKAYYNNAVGALVVFDVTRLESFQNVVAWMNELWKNNGRGPVPIIVLGNKADLRSGETLTVEDNKAQIFVSRLSQISRQHRGFRIHYLPTSAKTGNNIETAFELLGEAIMDFFASAKF